jgi:cysteine synthase A
MPATDHWSSIRDRLTTSAEVRDPVQSHRVHTYLEKCVSDYAPTPVARLSVRVDGRPCAIDLKLEGLSPWRSIKGRTALGLMASVAHRLGPDTMVVESTSGNLGVALARVCLDVGLRFTAIVDAALPKAMRDGMVEAGAELRAVTGAEGGSGVAFRVREAERYQAEGPDVVWPNQYSSVGNATVHECWTGPELAETVDLDGTAVLAPVSTGGTLSGLTRYLRAHQPTTRVVGVDVIGSAAFGNEPRRRALTGIGSALRSGFVTAADCDDVVAVSDDEGISACLRVAEMTGLRLGGSTGAAVAAAVRYLAANKDLDRVVCMSPDMGENYRETIYNPTWVRDGGFGRLTSRYEIQPMAMSGLGGRA